ncbi:hypothetical protein ANANG_G00248610 [Anguilla anguilla]|uniref:Uncharacterized protein n=1 Tax=Anguilla anguilla TaxID=7936 RepID=A0A9D3RQB7_ANGAN|nr:hypothetical protein ANANG_G00248610 [Anguilla anguilla]
MRSFVLGLLLGRGPCLLLLLLLLSLLRFLLFLGPARGRRGGGHPLQLLSQLLQPLGRPGPAVLQRVRLLLLGLHVRLVRLHPGLQPLLQVRLHLLQEVLHLLVDEALLGDPLLQPLHGGLQLHLPVDVVLLALLHLQVGDAAHVVPLHGGLGLHLLELGTQVCRDLLPLVHLLRALLAEVAELSLQGLAPPPALLLPLHDIQVVGLLALLLLHGRQQAVEGAGLLELVQHVLDHQGQELPVVVHLLQVVGRQGLVVQGVAQLHEGPTPLSSALGRSALLRHSSPAQSLPHLLVLLGVLLNGGDAGDVAQHSQLVCAVLQHHA